MNFTKRIISLVLVLVLSLSTLSITAFAKGDIKYGVAFVTGSGLRLRSSDSTSSSILDSASKGEVVVVVSKHDDWYKVIYDLQEGYMHADYLNVATKENAELGYGKINGSSVNLRSGPSTSHKAVTRGNKGDKVYIIGINEGWYKVIFKDKICYIRSDYVDLTEVPYENNGSSKSPLFFRAGKSTGVAVSAAALNGTINNGSSSGSGSTGSGSSDAPSTETPDTNTGSSYDPALGQQIVAIAKENLGVPYVWGGHSPSGFDCSGLVYYALKTLGFSPARTCHAQYGMGTYVAKADLQPGDLVFFEGTYKAGISHVGIYVGDGQFIHAPHSGSVVSYSDLNSTYYTNHYYGARRMG